MPEQQVHRVLMTTDTVGGVWTFTLELARGLAAQGTEVVLAALGGQPSASQREQALAVPGLCLLGSDFKLEWMDNPWDDVSRSGEWLLQLEREYSPDVVHLNSFGHGALPWSTPTVLTAHSCVLSWWRAVRGGEAPTSWNIYRAQVGKALRSAGTVVAPTAAMAYDIHNNYGLAFSRVRVVSNGIDPIPFRPGPKEPFVLSAGRLWDDAKNIRALVEIAPSLEWPVCLAGDDGQQRFDGCRLLGKLGANEMAKWYAAAAIYALPARYEPFGLSALEAALSGCALILGDIPTLREVWGDAALFVAPEDTDGLRSTIMLLASRPAFRREMADRANRRALLYGAAQMTSRYTEMYRASLRRESSQCAS